MKKRYWFQDQGQDLLYFDIVGDTIVAAGPFHNHLYAGMVSYDFYAGKTLKVGDQIRYSKGPTHPVETIKYPINSIETL